MILVIGGFAQGKREYAAARWPEKKIVADLQERLRGVADGKAYAETLLAQYADAVLICNEIGCGVVPLTPAERRWREETGRCLAALAAEAEEVHRVCCGLGLRLK